MVNYPLYIILIIAFEYFYLDLRAIDIFFSFVLCVGIMIHLINEENKQKEIKAISAKYDVDAGIFIKLRDIWSKNQTPKTREAIRIFLMQYGLTGGIGVNEICDLKTAYDDFPTKRAYSAALDQFNKTGNNYVFVDGKIINKLFLKK